MLRVLITRRHADVVIFGRHSVCRILNSCLRSSWNDTTRKCNLRMLFVYSSELRTVRWRGLARRKMEKEFIYLSEFQSLGRACNVSSTLSQSWSVSPLCSAPSKLFRQRDGVHCDVEDLARTEISMKQGKPTSRLLLPNVPEL